MRLVHRTAPAALAALLLAACGDTITRPGTQSGLRLVPVDSGFDFSIFVTAPPGDPDRLLVVERGGRILLRKNGVRQDSAFLNLTALTGPSSGEYGVYSLAFHPGYAANRRLYVYYADLNGDAQLAEYLADPSFDHADPTTRRTILSQPMPLTAVLYGGLMAFGPDRMLYLGIGDGDNIGPSTPSHAQDSTSLLGKMVRLDVDGGSPYAIPGDNPFVGRPGWRGEIWQLGLRNPWRWSFDRQSGDLWIADVGEKTWEEVNYLPPAAASGANLGWPVREGAHCLPPATACATAGLTDPVLEYPHSPACSVTGGHVYRGRASPALTGTYFYGDYCGGWVRSARLVGGQPVAEFPALSSPLINDNVVSFGEDADGEVYVVMASGRVYRLASD